MKDSFSNKLKLSVKRGIGRVVYWYARIINEAKKQVKNFASVQKNSKKKPNFVTFMAERWRLSVIVLGTVFSIYYGVGAAVSSKINNELDIVPKNHYPQGQQYVAALGQVLKIQVDEEAWTPAMPIIFPAGIIDNLPNFQMGVKDSVNFFITKLAKRYGDKYLAKASELLNYPANIWLFSQTKDEKLAPGSARQYRKALALLEQYLDSQTEQEINTDDFLFVLNSSNILIGREIAKLNKHIQEHGSETLNFKADDVFFRAKGAGYTLHYLLSAAVKDYQADILNVQQYENMTAVLKFLADIQNLNPLLIKNASPQDVYEANHLFYISYYFLLAQNRLQEVYYALKLKQAEKE